MTVLLAVVGFTTVAIAYVFAYADAAEFLDGQLRQVALNAGPGISPTAEPKSDDIDPEDRLAVMIWNAAGKLVSASLPQIAIPHQRKSGYANVTVDGDAWRVYTSIRPGQTVEVAQQETVRQEIAEGAALGAAAPILIIIPLSWLVVGFAMNRITRDLDSLTRDLAQRSASASEPIRLDRVPVEVLPLVTSMNDLILRLQAALDTQRRFLADAAHELRTPLAAMQIQLDNLASDPTRRCDGLAALAAGVRRASVLVTQLLRLARLDETRAGTREPIDVGAVLLDLVSAAALLAEHEGIDLGADVAPSCFVYGDAEELRTLLGNILDNALRYTERGGKVDVSLDYRAEGLVAEIVDTGPGIPIGEESRIFERFHRGVQGDVEGSGLGLAIARRVADRHGFALAVEDRRDAVRGAVARVVMPANNAR